MSFEASWTLAFRILPLGGRCSPGAALPSRRLLSRSRWSRSSSWEPELTISNPGGRRDPRRHVRKRLRSGPGARFGLASKLEARREIGPGDSLRPTTRPASPSTAGRSTLRHTEGEAGRGTNLETAAREGIAALPEGRVPRLVLVSDGNENLGGSRPRRVAGSAARRPHRHLRAGGPAPARTTPRFGHVARRGLTGERFPIDVAVTAPRATTATVEITAEGKVLGTSPVALEQGPNQLRVHTSLSTEGAVDLSGTLGTPGLGSVRSASGHASPALAYCSFRRTRRHRSAPAPGARSGAVRRYAGGHVPSGNLTDFQLVVFNNWNLEALSAPESRDRSLCKARRRRPGNRGRAERLRGEAPPKTRSTARSRPNWRLPARPRALAWS